MLGILALDTRFERIVGDTGNAASYPFPVRIHVVEGADSPLIVRDGAPDAALVARFIAAAQALEAEGARAIISTCGFLVSVQDKIAAKAGWRSSPPRAQRLGPAPWRRRASILRGWW